MKRLNLLSSAGLSFLLCLSCEPSYVPKPKGYPRMELPDAHYQCLPDTFPYVFEYSLHADIRPDSSWMAEPYWIHIYYPTLRASLQLTYKAIHHRPQLLKEYLEDTYRLVAKHQIKAYSIEEQQISLPQGGVVSIINLTGDVPTPFQFHITDSVDHFLRGALYFRTATRNDSLAPAIQYLRADLMHLLGTFQWKNAFPYQRP